MAVGAKTMSEVVGAELADGAVRWRMPELDAANSPPNVAKIEEVEQAAYREGYERGRAEGYRVGEAEVRRCVACLEDMVACLTQPLAETDAETENALVGLACEVAGALLCRTLEVQPEGVADMVRNALATLGTGEGRVAVTLHPDDVELVRPALDEDGALARVTLTPDGGLARGDCRIQTENAAVDGTLVARIARIREQLLEQR